MYLVPASPDRRDLLETFLVQILIELLSRQHDGAGSAAIPEHQEARRVHLQQPSRIAAVATRNWSERLTIADHELIDGGRVARHWIAEEVLSDAQSHGH